MTSPKRKQLIEAQKEKYNRQNELTEKFSNTNYKIRTRVQVQDLLEDLINGVTTSAMGKWQASVLASVIPWAWKFATELEPVGGGSPNMHPATVKISMSKTQTVSAAIEGMDSAQLDNFLRATEEEKLKILDRAQDKATIEVRPLKAEDVKIDARALSTISKNTNTPINIGRATRLFGRDLSRSGTCLDMEEKPPKPPKPDPNHVYERYMFKTESAGRPAAELKYRCRLCMIEYAVPKTEECEIAKARIRD